MRFKNLRYSDSGVKNYSFIPIMLSMIVHKKHNYSNLFIRFYCIRCCGFTAKAVRIYYKAMEYLVLEGNMMRMIAMMITIVLKIQYSQDSNFSINSKF